MPHRAARSRAARCSGIGLVLVAMAGFDFYLLQALAKVAQETPSTSDDAVFDSEVTIGLYVLPALLAGIGINVTSHILIQHLTDAQERFSGVTGRTEVGRARLPLLMLPAASGG